MDAGTLAVALRPALTSVCSTLPSLSLPFFFFSLSPFFSLAGFSFLSSCPDETSEKFYPVNTMASSLWSKLPQSVKASPLFPPPGNMCRGAKLLSTVRSLGQGSPYLRRCALARQTFAVFVIEICIIEVLRFVLQA